jgi:hypothetical protein
MVISKAQAGPGGLTAVERGQVAHVVSTEPGARQFSRASAPADWLRVFDPAMRYGTPWKNADTGLTVDPFDSYRLDDDSAPSPLDPDQPFAERKPPAGAWDAFALNADDDAALGSEPVVALRGSGSMNASRLPPRLHWLATWIAGVCDQPIVAWWAAGQRGLHTDLQRMITYHFGQLAATPPTGTEEAWRYLFRAWGASSEHNIRAHDLEAEIRRMGWSTATVRAWSRLLSPHLSVRQVSLTAVPWCVGFLGYRRISSVPFRLGAPCSNGIATLLITPSGQTPMMMIWSSRRLLNMSAVIPT